MASRDDVCGAPAAWRECIVRSRVETDATLTSDDEEFFGDHNKLEALVSPLSYQLQRS